ncbi:MAG TPA: MFS transporter, partial [Solirubrobacteraceae bacterium]|nr:MFS transporter [Solirubrobacteraceae bacterium]
MSSAADTATVGRTRWTRLIPVAIVVYIISFMDRTNIGFAFDDMGKSLHVTLTDTGLAGGIFFIGYLVLQFPGGHLAEHWSAKKFVGIMILIWGVLAILTGLVQNYTELLIVRFFLGVAEGGIWPAILVLISHWFPARERARAYGFWIMNIAIASIVTAPLSGWILSWGDWRWLFIIEGAFPFLVAAPLWFWLAADTPRSASWCTPEEREYIEQALAEDAAGEPEKGSYRDVLDNPVVWKLVAVYFLIQLGFYGLNLWLPHEITNMIGGSYLTVGWVTAIPYGVAIVGLWLNGRLADRTGRYRLHVLIPMIVAAVALVLSVSVGSLAALSIAFLSLAMMGALAYDGPFWASASRAVPVALAGGAMGLINALGNLGGFAGPYLGGWLQDHSGGSFATTSIALAISLALAGIVMLWVGRDGDKPRAQPTEAARTRRRTTAPGTANS